MMDLVVAVVGLAILLGAGDALVRGAVALSLRAGIPALLVSLTVVAFGTSAPELLISVQAVLQDSPGIALGNVVGSNIANVLLVLGAPALISTLDARDCDSQRNYMMMMIATTVFIVLLWMGPLAWPQGLLLLALLALVLGDAWLEARGHRRTKVAADAAMQEALEQDDLPDEIRDADPHMPVWRIGLLTLTGLIGLPLGANLLIEGARGVALTMGVTEAAIGLTLVAVGTSLPELATTVAAAMRRQADVAMGNVIGSNLFNLLAIMGAASLFGAIPAPPGFLVFDLWVMLAASVLMLPFVCRMARINRWTGGAMLATYGLYIAAALNMPA
ncbi:MAG: calcium/sodium antiporter [Pseudomonadota bacterium]